ncbi:MAG: hypothetical protein IPK09_00155 [Candidatus Competibacteraceae bacterium]|nr:hypothetical protein [Candidatus Competibacteraceae bacterium]
MNQHTQRSIPLLLALLALTAALTVYARCVLGYPICGTDEQNYLKIFDWLDGGDRGRSQDRAMPG